MPRLKKRTDHLEQVKTAVADDYDGHLYVAYLRHSTEDDQGASFEDQYRECIRAVEAKGGRLTKETALLDFHLAPDPNIPRRYVGAFGDRMKGIVPQRDRVGFGELMAFAAHRAEIRRPIYGVVVCDQSRHTRKKSLPLLAELMDLANAGLKVLFADGGEMIDPEADLVTLMKILIRGESNNQTAVDAAKKTLLALETLAKKGLWTGGSPPPGYRLVDALDVPSKNPKGCSTKIEKSGDPLHEELLKAAFTMPYERGLAATAEYLTRKGLRTSPTERNLHQRGPITINILRETILRNEIYCGLLTWPRRGRRRFRSLKRPATVGYGERESIETTHPELAYVTPDEFNAMQVWLKEQSSARGAFGQTKLLTGILKCPVHKTNLYEDGKGWYRCKHVGDCKLKGIPASLIENQVHSAIVLLLAYEKNASALVDHYSESRQGAKDKLDELEADLAEARRRRKRLLANYGDVHAAVDDASVLAAVRSLEREEARIESEMAQCQKELALTKEALLGLGIKFFQAPPAEKNAMLRTMLRKLKINTKTGLLEMQFSELLHNLHLTVKRYVLLPPSIDESPQGVEAATRAAARLVGEALAGRPSKAAVHEYKHHLGDWKDNCLVEFTLAQDATESPNGKPRKIGIMKYEGRGKLPKFELAEDTGSSERVNCGGGI